MDWSQLFLGLGLTVPATAIAYLGLKQVQKKDAAVVQSGLLTNHREGTGVMLGGYEGLVNQLQEQIVRCETRLDASNADRDALRLELARVRRKHGDNGV